MIGSHCIVRAKVERSRWKDPQVPEYKPYWMVMLRMPGGHRERRSSLAEICPKCLEVPPDQSPAAVRPNCRCLDDAKRFATEWQRTAAVLWKERRLDDLRKLRLRQELRVPTLAEFLAEYRRRCDAKDVVKQAAAAEMVICLPLGKPADKVRATEIVPDLWDKFAWMYQEAGRRGWLVRGGDAPADKWEVLFREMPECPKVDKLTRATWNTTIVTRMGMAKAVFGSYSRQKFLGELGARVPDCVLRWWETHVFPKSSGAPKPRQQFNLPREVYERMWAALPTLRECNPQVWALVWLHWTTGLRPIEVQRAREDWVIGDPRTGGLFLHVKQPAKELTSGDNGARRVWPLEPGLWPVLRDLCKPGGHLLGCESEAEWTKVYKAAGAWLRGCGVTTTLALYNLRKLVATVTGGRAGGDARAAAEALGNTPQVAAEHYMGTPKPLQGLTPEELTPEAVMGAAMVPWREMRAVG